MAEIFVNNISNEFITVAADVLVLKQPQYWLNTQSPSIV